jgi:hypothetical protein
LFSYLVCLVCDSLIALLRIVEQIEKTLELSILLVDLNCPYHQAHTNDIQTFENRHAVQISFARLLTGYVVLRTTAQSALRANSVCAAVHTRHELQIKVFRTARLELNKERL